MNLVEARLDGDTVELGSIRIALPPEHRPDARGDVVLGIRPESFEDAAFADLSLPQLDADVAVLEDLGADVHVIFPVDAPRVEAEDVRPDRDEEALIAGDGAVVHRARRRPHRRPPRPAAPARGRSGRLPLVRPGDRSELGPPRLLGCRRARPALAGRRQTRRFSSRAASRVRGKQIRKKMTAMKAKISNA